MSIGLTAFLAGMAVFIAVYAAMAPIHQMTTEQVDALRGLNPEHARAARRPGLLDKYVLPVVRNFLPQTPLTAVIKARNSSKVTELLVRSGNPWNIMPEEFFGIRLLGAVAGSVLGLLLAVGGFVPLSPVTAMLLFAALGYYYPKVKLDGIKGKRKKEAMKTLPEALDLLRIVMQSGQPFTPAVSEVAVRMPEGLIKVELQRVADELRTGRPLDSSLTDFARRAATQEVEAFCQAVVRADRVGADLTEVLQAQATEARNAYESALDVRTAKLSTTLFLPIIGLMVPSLFTILLAPAMSNISGAF